MLKHYTSFLLIAILFNCSLVAQDIRINEVVSSNSIHSDENGDTPDWIELHNFGTTPISLLNWGLTDNSSALHDWQFGNVVIDPDEYLIVWASDKNKNEPKYVRTLVDHGDTHNYILPTSELDTNWNTVNYNDTTWESGPSGFGIGDGDDATEVTMTGTSIFTRIKFTINDLENLSSLIFDVDYDDGFVAYINGVEIARSNVGGLFPSYDATATEGREAKLFNGAGLPERYTVDNAKSILVNGDNVLAIQVHNSSLSSGDLTMIPFLTAVFSVPSNLGIDPPEILNLTNSSIHTNFKISSSSDELFLTDENQNLVDQILVENLKPNTSYGYSSTTNNLAYHTTTTPGAINSDSNYLGTVTEEVIFSDDGGIINASSVNLTLSGNTIDQVIRYTTDATEPTENSPIYNAPIIITENTVVRAKIFQDQYFSSFSQSKTYIFNANHSNIDVIFLATDPENFFNEDTGIYVYGESFDLYQPYFGANFWEDWERPIHFSFYNKDSEQIETEFNAGVKIFGGWSRSNDQRSLSIFARGEYGTSEIEYPFFDSLTYDNFQSLVLRNSGNDWLNTSIRDASLTSLMEGSGLDFQAFNPVATYLNDEYWGLYNLREKVNEHFLASKHNVDPESIDLLANYDQVVQGSNTEYLKLIQYAVATDLSIDANFEYVKERVDLENLAMYLTAQIYINNKDWPGNNIKFWNHPEGKWRWILYDTDYGFAPWDDDDYSFNTLSFALEEGNGNDYWPNPDWSTSFFRNVLENISFRNQFVNRYADELNTRFLPDNVKNHIDNVYQMVEPEIDAHFATWADFPSNTVNNVNGMKSFAEKRHAVVKEHIKSQFDIPNFHKLVITNTDVAQGLVQVNNNLRIQENSWEGDYFETVPVTLTAIEADGYKFTHWSGASDSTEKTIELSLVGETTITPNFVVSGVKSIIINEISYKSGDLGDSDDWVELYNPNDSPVDVSNWMLKDDDDAHVFNFPSETVIEANSYLVVVKNEADFNAVFPSITNYIGELDFGLGGNDAVRLYNQEEMLEDEVYYDSNEPWPTCADGEGPSLELISTSLDNNLASSWSCSTDFGTPDAENSAILNINDVESSQFTFYPNPVAGTDYLYVKGNQINSVEVYTIIGSKVITQSFNNLNAVELNISDLNSGVYVLRINKSTAYKLIVK